MARGDFGAWMKQRNVGDILILLICSTVCLMVVGAGFGTMFALFFRPDVNVSQVINVTTDVINTLIGLMAGFLAGRAGMAKQPGQLDL